MPVKEGGQGRQADYSSIGDDGGNVYPWGDLGQGTGGGGLTYNL